MYVLTNYADHYAPHLAKVPEDLKEAAAFFVANDLIKRAEMCGAIFEPDTWVTVAEDLNLIVDDYHEPGRLPGCYLPEFRTVSYNTARSFLGQCRVLIHEISHHLLFIWMPPRLADMRDAYYYDDNRDDVHHCIARRVEHLVLGEE